MYNIVSDSSLDLSKFVDNETQIVPFKIDLDGKTYVDDSKLDIKEFIEKMLNCSSFKTSCPSPNDYYEAFKKKGDVFCITITSKLSGSFNSAILAKNMIQEEIAKRIKIIDSGSASPGLALIYLELKKYISLNMSFDDISKRIDEYAKKLETLFVLDSLENLRKAGRLSNLKAIIAKKLNIVPVMQANNGFIEKVAQARGKKKAFDKLVQLIEVKSKGKEELNIIVSHAGNIEQAEKLKESIIKRLNPNSIMVISMNALNTMYSDYKGVIVSF